MPKMFRGTVVDIFSEYFRLLHSLKDIADKIDQEISYHLSQTKSCTESGPTRWPGAPSEIVVTQSCSRLLTCANANWHEHWLQFTRDFDSDVPTVEALRDLYIKNTTSINAFLSGHWYRDDLATQHQKDPTPTSFDSDFDPPPSQTNNYKKRG